ncbi:MAG TPA: methyl-accepting chemotaxis protein [Polyangiaceae bacterium]|jgi:methyl-accepting chemotaxis protein|nr:methyl-accepting chemotaxis protein [Polyangiaceae bacterium]
MNALSPRTLLAFFVPVGATLALISMDPSYRLPAWIMAVVSLAAVWLAAAGGQSPTHWTDLSQALRAVPSGKSLPPLPETAPVAVQRAWRELERLSESLQQREAEAAANEQRLKGLLETAQREAQANAGLGREGISRLRSLDQRLQESVDEIQRASTSQQEVGETATRHTQEFSAVFAGIVGQAETLASSAEEGSSAILQMTTTNDRMAENIGELSASVRESVASIEEMTFSIKEVAKNVDALSLTAEETSSSMNEMDVSIDQVQSNANETARLSEEVARDAETGAEAILKTIGEIYRIKESSQEAVSVISNLGSRIDAIGQILNVIDDVAEQTNLLALNAAIIAAQAGEHGKGFAVVADEIKDLAERAGASTKEIADLIKTIQSESRNAIQAVERGAQNVDRGVQVSNDAERALKKILESSQKSTNMVRAIARATVEQAKGSRQVTDAIGRIAETVQQIAAATAEQARGSELIMTSGEKMRTIAQQVERSSQEQSRGGRQITQAIENISLLAQQLNNGQKQRRQDSERVLGLMEEFVSTARKQRVVVERLREAQTSVQDLVRTESSRS